jgi:PAS domain S-box-containing protein
MFDRVFAGEPFYMDDFSLALKRNGVLAEAHFSFSYTPVRDQRGTVAGLFGTCIETTASVVNARLLAKSEERLQIALSAGNSVGTWDWDVPSDRVFADARFAELYGVDPERASGGAPIAAFFGGIHPDDVGRVQAAVAESLETGGPLSSEYRLPRPDGQERWVVAQGRCVLSPDGKPLRLSGLSLDITDRKKAEIRREALVRLTDDIRDLQNPEDLTFAASTMSAEPVTALSIRMLRHSPSTGIGSRRAWNHWRVRSTSGTTAPLSTASSEASSLPSTMSTRMSGRLPPPKR